MSNLPLLGGAGITAVDKKFFHLPATSQVKVWVATTGPTIMIDNRMAWKTWWRFPWACRSLWHGLEGRRGKPFTGFWELEPAISLLTVAGGLQRPKGIKRNCQRPWLMVKDFFGLAIGASSNCQKPLLRSSELNHFTMRFGPGRHQCGARARSPCSSHCSEDDSPHRTSRCCPSF